MPPSKPSLRILLSKPPKASNAYNWLPSYQWTFTIRDYPQSLNPSVSQHLQPLKDKDYKNVFLSHKIYDYKSTLNAWINETKTNLKLNDNVVINPCLNLIELIYRWSWKLVIINFLHTVGSPFISYRIIVLTLACYHCAEI